MVHLIIIGFFTLKIDKFHLLITVYKKGIIHMCGEVKPLFGRKAFFILQHDDFILVDKFT